MIYGDNIIDNVVTNFFDNETIKKGDEVLIGLSGGMDSMCLCDVMYKLHDEFSFSLKAIHVNHGIRGKEANADMNFVANYCKSLKIELIKSNVEAKEYSRENGLSLEEGARILRYKEFDKIWRNEQNKKNNHNVYVVVAHHLKDQAETIIHNIVRGTGIKGLVGMNYVNGYILRPFLHTEKKDIELYVKKYDVPFVNDRTNEDTTYTRNYIRKEVIDRLMAINDNALKHIDELSQQASEINTYLEMLAKYLFKDITIAKDKNKIIINLKLFRNISHIIKCYIIREIFGQLVSTLKDITKVNIEDIIEISNKEKGCHLDLPYNMVVDKKQNNLIFEKKSENISMSRRKKK